MPSFESSKITQRRNLIVVCWSFSRISVLRAFVVKISLRASQFPVKLEINANGFLSCKLFLLNMLPIV